MLYHHIWVKVEINWAIDVMYKVQSAFQVSEQIVYDANM